MKQLSVACTQFRIQIKLEGLSLSTLAELQSLAPTPVPFSPSASKAIIFTNLSFNFHLSFTFDLNMNMSHVICFQGLFL